MEAKALPYLQTASGLRAPGAYGPLSRFAAWVVRLAGWRIEVADPMPEKCVIVMYPHTSNWDFVFGLLTKWCVGLTVKGEGLSFAGKESLFKGPWAAFFRAVGGFPVNRGSASGFVDQMAVRFANEPRMRFVIAPEGTRSYTAHVRSSFYYVALAARVPVVLGAFDFAGKRVVVNTFMTLSGDVATDLALIANYYQTLGNQGDRRDHAAPWSFRT
jgi:1-acyl-sn-glycerol-3-phosphate acyltransferase